MLWHTRGREQAQASLRQSLYELRRSLAPLKNARVESENDHLTLHIQDLWIDAIFVQTPAFLASHMLDVFRGPLLRDLLGLSDSFDAWLGDERRRVSGRIAHKLASVLSDTSCHATTVRLAEAVLASDTSHVAAWTALVRSRLATGDAVAALDACHRCLTEFRKSGLDPGPDLNRMLAGCLPEAAPAGKQAKTPVASGPYRILRNGGAFASPWRAAYLAVAPTRGVGNASAEFAACLDWQIMSALCKFEDLSCSPVPPARLAEAAPRELAEEGFDFLLEGWLERIADQDYFSVRLRDLHLTGEVFWSQRIVRKASSGSLVEADFASVLAPQIAAEILRQQSLILENCPEGELNVCELVLRASRSVQRLDRPSLSQADRLLSEAIKRDPRHPSLLAWSAYVHLLQLGQGWFSDIAGPQRHIGELVERGLSLNPQTASTLAIAGHILAFTQNRLEEGLSLQERALAKNPNLPSAWLFSGLAHTYAGEHKEAINRLERAKALSPSDQQAYFIDMGLGFSYLLDGDAGKALTASRSAIRQNPNFSSSFKVGVSASGYTDPGRGDPALLQGLLQLEPALTVQRVLSRNPLTRRADQARLCDGLRLAGLPRS
jgi:DNA-binding SARP family transcriptional activator/tetratricopeptide (TPR) repeat protein